MRRSEAAAELYDIVENYLDCLKYGEPSERITYDFTPYDNIDDADEISSPAAAAAPVPAQGYTIPAKNLNPAATEGLIDIASAILKCARCELSFSCKNRVPGDGRVDSKIVVISGAPGADEIKRGLPLTDAERDFFYKWTDAISIDRNDIFFTNIVKCSPGRNPVKRDHIEACRGYLDNQLKIVNPRAVITLGALPFASLRMGKVAMDKEHGVIFQYNGFKVIPLFHPSEVLSAPQLKAPVWNDLKTLKNNI